MGEIVWIEDSLSSLENTDFSVLVDRDRALRVAIEEPLEIDEPARQVSQFTSALPSLFSWFGANYRDFPWRRTQDPWEILVAEILLQRTRAVKVDEIYRQFFNRFVDVETVHAANDDELFEIIEPAGMGNKKTHTLKTLAEILVKEHDGNVPNDIVALQELPRIGPYTARACLCFAYGEPLAIVDANIEMVVEHVFGYDSPQRAHKDKALYAFLDALVPSTSDAARLFNLAILDLRALVCVNEFNQYQCPFENMCLHLNSGNNHI